MRNRFFAFVGLGALLLWSCGNQAGKKSVAENTVLQQEDGTLLLDMGKATCYNDEVNPSSNTAEWKVRVSKPGRFKVWLSSATKDTTELSYNSSVKISFLDNELEAEPACDKIVRNAREVSYPYYRADSYMGSFYISDPGEYNIQVISEKVLPREAMNNISSGPDDTKLMSVILTPNTR